MLCMNDQVAAASFRVVAETISSSPSIIPKSLSQGHLTTDNQVVVSGTATTTKTDLFAAAPSLLQGYLDIENEVIVRQAKPTAAAASIPNKFAIQGYLSSDDEVVVNNMNTSDASNDMVPHKESVEPSGTTKSPTKDYVQLLRQRKRELEQVLLHQAPFQTSPIPGTKPVAFTLPSLLAPKMNGEVDGGNDEEDEEHDDDAVEELISWSNFSKASRQYNVQIVSDMSDISWSEWEDGDDDKDSQGQEQRSGLPELENDGTTKAAPTTQPHPSSQRQPQPQQQQQQQQQQQKLSNQAERRYSGSQEGYRHKMLPLVDPDAYLPSPPTPSKKLVEKVRFDKNIAANSTASASTSSGGNSNDIECVLPLEASLSSSTSSSPVSPKNDNREYALRKQSSLSRLSFLGTDNTTLTADSTATAALRMKRSLMWMIACLSLLVIMLIVTVTVVTLVAIRNRDSHSNSSPMTTSSTSTSTSTAAPRISPIIEHSEIQPTEPPRKNIFHLPMPPSSSPPSSSPPSSSPVSSPTDRKLVAAPAPTQKDTSHSMERTVAKSTTSASKNHKKRLPSIDQHVDVQRHSLRGLLSR